jgi:hypothetical protein
MIGNIVEVNAQYVLDLLSPQWIAGNDHEFIMDSAVAAGDVLVARTGATIGKVAVVPDGAPSPLNICSDILRLRPSGIDPYYLAAFLASDLGQRQLYANISGSTNEHLSPEALELVQVPLLPDAEEIGRSYRECVRERLERDFAARALFDHMETDLSD